jgi:hypothetical protein
VLETTAAFLAWQSFCSQTINKHVRLELDNTTAVAYVNNMGGNQSSECNAIVRQIRLWTDDLKSFNAAAPIEKLKLFRTNIPVMVSKTQNNLAPMEKVAQ